MTLTELLVAISILGVVAASIAGALAIGIHVLGAGGAQPHLVGSQDLLAFEQQLGADVARADCLSAPGQPSLPSGGCTSSTQKPSSSTCGASYRLCLAWYVPGVTTCHTVVYLQQPDGTIIRSDLFNSGGVPTSKTERVTVGSVAVTASWTTIAINGYQWTKAVRVNVVQTGISSAVINAPNTTFVAVPRGVDPISPVLSPGAQAC